jgi:gamma-tubulin complex component 2
MPEKRSERIVITSREKAVRRNPANPVKESISAANRGDWDKTRPRKLAQLDDANPSARIGEKDPADCE